MKKIIVLLSAALMSATLSHAQTPVGYQGEVDAGYSLGTRQAPNGANLHVINGISVGNFFSAGVGVGVDYYYDGYGDDGEVIPVFVNMKGYLPTGGRVRPFLSLDMGVGIGVGDALGGQSGVLYTPAVGCALTVGQSNQAILISVGYHVQQFAAYSASLNLNTVSFKIGFQF